MTENSREDRNKKITITEVAKRAGVSVGTVSHALNNVGYVNAATKEKVQKAAEELGYVPNRAGRTLKTRKTGLIMMAIPDTSNEIYFGMIQAMLTVTKQNGYSMLLYYTNGDMQEELKTLQLLKEHVVDGLFLVHFSYDHRILDEIRQSNRPVVLCGMCNHLWANSLEPFDTVSIDVYEGIYAAVRHLVQMGHQKIGYLAGKLGTEVYRQRYQAYRDALKEFKLEFREDYVLWNDYSEIGGYNSGRTLFQLSDRPTAICASNDQQAIGCWQAIRDLGGKVPADMALTGLDNLNISNILNITSLNMKETSVGEEAARLLFWRLAHEDGELEYQNIYLRPELVVRESTLGSL
ncbi:LacI family DNA-binding transcriptional regulator [Lactonifactor longoviformis]|uniref:LacI family DNA-binding transcriptional regulator n=1 Tax=Lactonifactor longoviformis TaxID=341220 RepID=UPI001D035BAF|nr:LacI family DNA-binding transcriptional regulator [Lactonifactor longoviformis]MCB5711957.1 LacI family transcriptional regulator [Lactonifactor longoviformis]MCB5715924.1 LacI family transcriptional regulator [Lactonifactor longoviformis]